ncbi:uncharacterized protein DEA37_0000001 [Paragonimus westermani]|uniref:Uncharacterized protein n=1 Tax=Paragonimus westermani TaxID=34504 RepID=A0A5J4N898_9TREM|nr:uncharacterized protein DEA37_0000001 [Paragonimus westermani]
MRMVLRSFSPHMYVLGCSQFLFFSFHIIVCEHSYFVFLVTRGYLCF